MASVTRNNITTKINNAMIPNVDAIIAAGINPETNMPIKMGDGSSFLKERIKHELRIIDEQDAINRYVWYNLPPELNSQLIERMLYYKGQCAFAYIQEKGEYVFLPYALNGSIDIYGRYTGVNLLPWRGTTSSKDDKEILPAFGGKVFKPLYKTLLPEEAMLPEYEDSCVLLSDYSKQISEINTSRQLINDPLLDVMSDMIPFMRTNLLNSTGIQGMRVSSQDEQANVKAASRAINRAALEGEKYIPVIGMGEFQDLTGGTVAKSEEFMLALQSLDNFRLSLFGLDNGGLFQKKAHMLQSESDMNSGAVGLVAQDGLTLRQDFCRIVNLRYNLNIWCEISENVIGMDRNLDGMIGDNQASPQVTNNYGGQGNDME